MAISFPLPLADFFSGLSPTSISFELGENVEGGDQTGKGEILTYAVGERLWGGTIHIAADTPRKQEKVKAKLDLLRNAGGSFLVGHPDFKFPESDPNGSILGAANITVQSIDANNREMVLAGAPAGYTLTEGDHLSIEHGGTHSYYRIVTGGQFTGSPTATPQIEVQPFIHGLVAAGMTVKVVRPVLKAVYVPGSYKPGARVPGITQGVTFRWRQTYL